MSLRFSLLAGFALAFTPFASAQNASPVAEGTVSSVVFNNSSVADCVGGENVSEAGLTSFFRNYADTGVFIGQSFTAPCDGALDQLEISIYSLAADPAPKTAGTFTLTLVEGAGGTGAVLATQAFTLDQPAATNTVTPVTLDIDDSFVVSEGQVYTIFYVQIESGFQIIANNDPSYDGGELFITTTGDIADAEPAVGMNGEEFDQTFNLTFMQALVAAEGGPEGSTVAIGSAIPNPTTSRALVPFSLQSASDVQMTVFDTLGRMVEVIAEGTYAAGSHTVDLDAASLSPGTYVVRLVAGQTVVTRTVSVVR